MFSSFVPCISFSHTIEGHNSSEAWVCHLPATLFQRPQGPTEPRKLVTPVGSKGGNAQKNCHHVPLSVNPALVGRSSPYTLQCIRVGRYCDYSDNSRPPSSSDFAFLRRKVQELEQRLDDRPSASQGSFSALSRWSEQDPLQGPMLAGAKLSTFPTMFFLDSVAFDYARASIPKPMISVPGEVLSLLGNASDIQDLCGNFFLTIHQWLPFVSKKRLYQNLTNPKTQPGADLALLFSCMKLVAQSPPNDDESVQSPFYWLVKQFYSLVESRGLFSIQLIQSSVLISVYEIGHGIYPAAYLTTGHSARLGTAMGLHDRKHSPQMLRRPGTWTEQEELRRVWWSILFLDRYVNLGSRGHPLASEEPSRNDVLPCEDSQWDQGEMTPSEPIFVSSATSIRAGPFGRSCQAAHLLGRVIRHRNDWYSEESTAFRFTEAAQLHRTVLALASLLPTEFESSPDGLITPLAICYSTQLDLYDPYSCTESNRGEHTVEETEMQEIAIAGLKHIAEDVYRFAQHLKRAMKYDLAAVSPLVSDCLYQAAANYAWLVRESGNPEMFASLNSILDAVKMLDRRWKIGGEYVKLLEAVEFSMTGEG